VIELLAREGQCLLTVAQMTERLRKEPVGSAASIYRAVDELHELGLLHRLSGADGIARYEIADPVGHHHHLVDETTGNVVPFTDDVFERAILELADRLELDLTGHDVVLRGRLRAGARTES
jgi:Fur family ferric uptake transcriptional regulator